MNDGGKWAKQAGEKEFNEYQNWPRGASKHAAISPKMKSRNGPTNGRANPLVEVLPQHLKTRKLEKGE